VINFEYLLNKSWLTLTVGLFSLAKFGYLTLSYKISSSSLVFLSKVALRIFVLYVRFVQFHLIAGDSGLGNPL